MHGNGLGGPWSRPPEQYMHPCDTGIPFQGFGLRALHQVENAFHVVPDLRHQLVWNRSGGASLIAWTLRWDGEGPIHLLAIATRNWARLWYMVTEEAEGERLAGTESPPLEEGLLLSSIIMTDAGRRRRDQLCWLSSSPQLVVVVGGVAAAGLLLIIMGAGLLRVALSGGGARVHSNGVVAMVAGVQ